MNPLRPPFSPLPYTAILIRGDYLLSILLDTADEAFHLSGREPRLRSTSLKQQHLHHHSQPSPPLILHPPCTIHPLSTSAGIV
ncbi:hypothetical protein GDO81_010867 [Engystomops pustulosus]|uniref:Uncharacterized protein n=1 Tax=Engystomops pustulosus TaxID=76066 RepID=A0AAV7C384_ENGPU|nr:hypothetical protein GDO81_010867 [Engystomops pustulosus]